MSGDPPPENAAPERLGLVAGNGRFPVILAQNARRRGVQVVAVALEGETLPELEQHVDSLHWAGIAKLGKVIRIFQRAGVTQAVMAGGVAKAKLWNVRRSIYIDDFHTLTATTSEDLIDDKDVDAAYTDVVVLEGNWADAL